MPHKLWLLYDPGSFAQTISGKHTAQPLYTQLGEFKRQHSAVGPKLHSYLHGRLNVKFYSSFKFDAL